MTVGAGRKPKVSIIVDVCELHLAPQWKLIRYCGRPKGYDGSIFKWQIEKVTDQSQAS